MYCYGVLADVHFGVTDGAQSYETISETNKNCIAIFQLLKCFQLCHIKLPSVTLLQLN